MSFLYIKIDLDEAQTRTGPKVAAILRRYADNLEHALIPQGQSVDEAMGCAVVPIRDKNGDRSGEMWVNREADTEVAVAPSVASLHAAGSHIAEACCGYDYKNQCWVMDGRYQPCGHTEAMDCDCFGKTHAGELVPSSALPNLH